MVIEVPYNELLAFLYETKTAQAQNSWRTRVHRHEEGDFTFQRTEKGLWKPVVHELVYFRGHTIWGMCMFGGYRFPKDFNPKAEEVLKKAVSQMSETYPVRGMEYVEGPWHYSCHTSSESLEDISGQETLLLHDNPLYMARVLGGKIEADEEVSFFR